MNNFKSYKLTALPVLCIALIVMNTMCTKEGENSKQVSRALVAIPDSALFSPFYDTTSVPGANVVGDANNYAVAEGVFTIIHNNCASDNCHGGGVSPRLTSYQSIRNMVVPGNPEASLLFRLITTSDLNQAMPPISYGIDLTVTEKSKIYNWIKNGADETPGLEDYRPAAVSLISSGCGSANCHNEATVGGEWARAKLINIAAGDTTTFSLNGREYAQLKEPVLSQVWNAYKDSVRKFYADTVANKSFRPYKTMNSPVVQSSRRGPLNTYDDLLFDIYYPKALRSSGSVQYIDPATGQRFYVSNDPLNGNSTLLSRVDSTILAASPRTGVFRTTHQGQMAYQDGGMRPGDIGIIKGWYFLDPNIPDVWKYGLTGTGIFKYRSNNHIITK